MSSPASSKYANQKDSHTFANFEFSIGQNKRFHIPSSLERIYEKVPVQYAYENPASKRSRSKQVSIGYGQKYDFTEFEKKLETTCPAPNKYNNHIKDSIAYKSNNLPKRETGFYNNYASY